MAVITSADVRTYLTRTLRLDLIGPEADEPQTAEVLPIAPSRWYLTGFLVPWNAPVHQKSDDNDTQGELEYGDASADADEDSGPPEPRAARRSHFPSSMGLSVLLAPDAATLSVTVRWGDYAPIAKDGMLTGEWRRTERSERVTIRIVNDRARPAAADVPDGGGLQIVASIRRVRGLEDMPGLPPGTRAASVFLVNRREPFEGVDDRFSMRHGGQQSASRMDCPCSTIRTCSTRFDWRIARWRSPHGSDEARRPASRPPRSTRRRGDRFSSHSSS